MDGMCSRTLYIHMLSRAEPLSLLLSEAVQAFVLLEQSHHPVKLLRIGPRFDLERLHNPSTQIGRVLEYIAHKCSHFVTKVSFELGSARPLSGLQGR